MNENNFVPGTAGGTHVAGMPLTLEATAKAAPGLLRNTLDSRIVKIRPSATPIDQISRMSGARPCSSMTVDYYSVDTKATETPLSRAIDLASAAQRPDGSRVVHVNVDDIKIFNASDTVYAAWTAEDGTHMNFTGYVVEITERGVLEVVPVEQDGKPCEGTVPAGTPLVRMGRAAAELDVQSPQFQAMPVKASNNCQIFKMQVEQSTLQKMADKEVGWTLSDQEEAAIIDMRMGMEKNFLFGRCGKVYDGRKDEQVYLTGGIWHQTDNVMELDVEHMTHDDLIDICTRAFAHKNGSQAKMLVGGTDFIAAVSKVPASRVIDVRDSRAKWGIQVREIVSNFGMLYLVHSDMFDQCGHSHDGFVIDPVYITKYTHIPFHAEKLNLRSSGTRNTDAVVLTEASCLVLRYPGSHLKVVHTPGV